MFRLFSINDHDMNKLSAENNFQLRNSNKIIEGFAKCVASDDAGFSSAAAPALHARQQATKISVPKDRESGKEER
jgi:hypothetical protein